MGFTRPLSAPAAKSAGGGSGGDSAESSELTDATGRPDGGGRGRAAAGAVAAAATAARRAAASSARSVAIVAAFFSASVFSRAFSLSNCARFISEAARRAWSWSGSPACFDGGEGRRRTGDRLFGGFASATFGLLGVSGLRRRADIVLLRAKLAGVVQ